MPQRHSPPDPWIDKYIFPNSHPPSAAQITRAIEDLFLLEDWENWAPDYDRTVMAWFRNFHQHWRNLQAHYDLDAAESAFLNAYEVINSTGVNSGSHYFNVVASNTYSFSPTWLGSFTFDASGLRYFWISCDQRQV